jgi:MFS family permease
MGPALWPLVAMTAIQSFATMTLLVAPVLGPSLAADVGFEPSWIGAFSSLTFLGGSAVSFVSGALIRRYGAIRSCQAGLLVAVVGLLLLGSGWLPLMLAAAFLVGVGYGPTTPAGSQVLARVTPARYRGLVFSIKQAGVPLGGFMTGLIAPWIAVRWGWEAALAAIAGAVALTALASHPLRRAFDADRDPRHPISAAATLRAMHLVLAHPGLRRMSAMSFAFAATQNCVFAFLVTFLVAGLGYDLVAAGLVYAAMQGAGIGARVLWGWVADLLGRARALLAVLGFGSAVFLLALASASAAWPFWLLCAVAALVGITASGWNGVYLAEVARIAPDSVSSSTGGTLVFTYLGVVAGPALFTLAIELTGDYGSGFHMAAALAAAGGAAMLVGGRDGPAPAAA